MTGQRLDAFPEQGRVVVGHPDNQQAVAARARAWALDYFLSPRIPEGELYILNADAIPFPP